MNLVKQCVTTKYASFSGRASRKEYWGFIFFYISLFFFIVIADTIGGGFERDATGDLLMSVWAATLIAILYILLLIPSLAVFVRRLHDTDHSAWWLFIALIPIIGSIVILYFLVIKGTDGSNRFGVDPLGK